MLVLSIFPGIGLLDRAFEEEGFCVVRGPDQLWGGNIKEWSPPPGRFDGIIGGPPGMVVGGAVGAAVGMVTKPSAVNLGQPAWR